MTNIQLSYILKNMNLSEGKSVRVVDDLEAILMKDHETRTVTDHRRRIHYHDYLVLLKGGEKAGILLNCDSKDIHAYVLRKYRNQHIVSRLTDNGFLKELWPDVNSVTCADLNNYDKVKHLAEIAGYSLNDESLTWV